MEMKGKMHIYYDEEADFLEINIGKYTDGYFRDVGEGISERVDQKTGKVTGIAIMGFRKKAGRLKDIEISLPINIEMSS